MMNKPTVLIIDDNESNRDICCLSLEELDVITYEAENGKTGLKMTQSLCPDLILLDIMMPEMDGFEVLENLRNQSFLKDIPVLMLTARSGTENVVRALEMGANDYLRKPFDEEEMVARAKTLIKNRMLEKQVKADLNAGAAMQKKFLTHEYEAKQILQDVGLNLAVFNRPFSSVSGDFYYAMGIDSATVGLFLGDACGHGLPAALISMRILGLLQGMRPSFDYPGEYLASVNHDLYDVLPQARFIAGCCLVLKKDVLRIANAGQPYPIFISKGTVSELDIAGYPLGTSLDRCFLESEIRMEIKDKIIIYSDGIKDRLNQLYTHFGKKQFLSFLKEHAFLPAVALKEHFIKQYDSFFKKQPPEDDLTLIIIEKENE